MTGRVVSSDGDRGDHDGSRGRAISSSRAEGDGPDERDSTARRANKARAGISRRSASGQPRKPRSVHSDETRHPDGRHSAGDNGAFVDARELSSEDIVSQTLQETAGTLGVAARPKVVDFSARLKERKRAKLRKTAFRVGMVVAGCCALAALAWMLFFSPVLRLETSQISVSGANEWVSQAEIMAIAGKQAGKSLLVVSTGEVTDQLKDIPGVSDAKADKHFPKGLKVTIVAQKPAALLKVSDGTLTAVDGKGRVLNSVKGTSVTGIPVIEVSSLDSGLNNRAVREAVEILSSLPEWLRQRITTVVAKTQDSITTQLDGGQHTVVWGDSSELALKKAVVDKILNDPATIGDKHEVDVSAPLRPILK